MKQKEKGITLIALVVTIVVLLILAAVSIGMLTGENGIIKQAVNAKDETIIGKEKEGISVGYSGCLAGNLGKTVSADQLENEMKNNGNNVIVQGTETLTITYLDTNHIYTIDTNGTIVAKEEIPGNLVFDVPEDSEFSLICGDNITAYFVEYDDTKTGKKENEASAKLASTTPVNAKIADDDDKYYEMVFVGTGEMWGAECWVSNSDEHTYIGSDTGLCNSCVDGNNLMNIVKSIKISYGISSLAKKFAFQCFDLVEVYIPEGIDIIGEEMFMGTKIMSLKIPDGLKSIGDYSFEGCGNLECISFPSSLIEIGNGAFYRCRSLESLIIPTSVNSVGRFAFEECSGLKTVNYLGTMDQWKEISIDNSGNTYLINAKIICTDGIINE